MAQKAQCGWVSAHFFIPFTCSLTPFNMSPAILLHSLCVILQMAHPLPLQFLAKVPSAKLPQSLSQTPLLNLSNRYLGGTLVWGKGHGVTRPGENPSSEPQFSHL